MDIRGVFVLMTSLLCLVLGQDSCQSNYSPDSERKVWTVAHGHDWGANEYFDARGYIQGFSVDIVNAVCGAAGIECRTVWDKYSNCITSEPGQHTSGGQGLMAGWYDACLGWMPTVDRVHIFDFSMPYLKSEESYFYVLPNNPNGFNPQDLRNKNIAMFPGWMQNEKCLARHSGDTGNQGYILSVDQITYVDSPEQAFPLLQAGTVDAIFTGSITMSGYVQNQQVEQSSPNGLNIACNLDGDAVMTRKDSEFVSHWNRGFQKLRATGKLYKLCQQANQEHGDQGEIVCVD